jgi:hypothetical protein
MQFSPTQNDFMREHIKLLLEQGVMELSSSQYSSPMFYSLSLIIHIGLLWITGTLISALKQSVLFSVIHTTFHWFCKAKYFTTLDLNQAYQQIPLSEESKHLTAFCTDWNLYLYLRFPFGLATCAQVYAFPIGQDISLCKI